MFWLRSMLGEEKSSTDLLISTSRYAIFSTISIYLIFHFVASLFFTSIFSPRLWACTIIILVTFLLTILLIKKLYLAAQFIWLSGLFSTILTGFYTFRRPEILFLLAVLPIMAIVMMGIGGAAIVDIFLVIATLLLPKIQILPAIPYGYPFALIFCYVFGSIFGWGISSNLLAAIEESSFHYYEARKRLEETRKHRAEISHMLKEQSQSNYQLKQMNRMLEQARENAEEAKEDRDRFAMAVSHELRTPLNFIIGFSDLMVHAPETYTDIEEWPPGLYDDIQEIYNSSQHLLGLINDILDMGKIDAKRMPIFRERIKPIIVLEEIEKLVSAQVEAKGLKFLIHCDPELPYIYVDRTRIRQVLLNVVTNSLRFTRQGHIKINAGLISDEEIEIAISDTGPGISEEDLLKIFDEFRQVGQENWSREKGSGLGLSISRRFVELHGGKMRVESRQNQGTMIRITLPVLEPLHSIVDEREDLQEGGELRLASIYAKSQNPVVLCFSKDSFRENLLSQSIIQQEIVFVENFSQFEESIGSHYPSAIIIDEAIEDQEVLQNYLRQMPYDIPVISFLFSAISNRSFALPYGVYRYLVKPVTREKLILTIDSLGKEFRSLLVVDDDPTLVRLFTQAIKSSIKDDPALERFEFIPAYSGREALDYLETHKIDAVLLDLDLPDLHGTQVLAEIQKDERLVHMPVIIISASELNEELPVANSAALRIVVNRPFEVNELSSVIRAVLNQVKPVFQERNRSTH
jgi:signal transduction histidine kinase/CheY-like chemotaxis protein